MTAYLIGEDGPYTGTEITLDDGDQWIFGRDSDSCFFVLEDPMVSRRHAKIMLVDDKYIIENLSTINPLQINGESVEDSAELNEEDILQIGNNYFRFTKNLGDHPEPETEQEAKPKKLKTFSLSPGFETRFLLKVISGPNQGAEFGFNAGQSQVLGKDTATCDIVFQDLSVSREHAKLIVSPDGDASIEDLKSRNGTFVNGEAIENIKTLNSQDLLTFGTTSCLFIDKEEIQETIYSAPATKSLEKTEEIDNASDKVKDEKKPWKDTVVPTKHLVIASVFSVLVFISIISLFGLFKSEPIIAETHDENYDIEKVLTNFEDVTYNYNPSNGTVFLIGHVLTDVDHAELFYLMKGLPYIQSIEDNVIIDEKVYDQMNAMLSKNPEWRSLRITAPQPGTFVLKGYLETEAELGKLQEYLNLNFPYLNLLENHVVVEESLNHHVQGMLFEKGFTNVTFQVINGEVVLSGRVQAKEDKELAKLIKEMSDIHGVRSVKNFVLLSDAASSTVDLSDKYVVTGMTKHGSVSEFVLINGKILSKGDVLDGMTITGIKENEVELNKDGINYKIDYNPL